MKNLMILMVLASTMAFTACEQKSKIPAKVKTTFTEKFPNATKISCLTRINLSGLFIPNSLINIHFILCSCGLI